MPDLSVTVSRVAYPPATAEPESWYILVTDHGACKGRMLWRPQPQEQLILSGEWTTYQGEREFSFNVARIDIPADSWSQLHYVCVRTPGLGNAAESQIWEAAGEDWAEIEEGAIARLRGKVYEEFRLQVESLRSKSEQARVVAALMGQGATEKMAEAAWLMWGDDTIGVIHADCYRLSDLPGYGFRDVDMKIRQHYEIADNDPRRVCAAVVYTLRRLTNSGNTVVAWELLYSGATALLGGFEQLISDCTGELFSEGTLKAFAESGGVSLAADWIAENAIWDWVNERTA